MPLLGFNCVSSEEEMVSSGRLGSGVWCGRNSNASRIKVPPFHSREMHKKCRVGGWRVPTQFPIVRGTIFAHFSLRSRQSKGGSPEPPGRRHGGKGSAVLVSVRLSIVDRKTIVKAGCRLRRLADNFV